MAIKLSKFHDQPARRITANRQMPLMTRTIRLREISRARWNAMNRESRTRKIIGPTTFHMFALTRMKISWPNICQLESQTWSFGSSDSSFEIVDAGELDAA